MKEENELYDLQYRLFRSMKIPIIGYENDDKHDDVEDVRRDRLRTISIDQPKSLRETIFKQLLGFYTLRYDQILY
jgi:hypothetical protein